MAMISISLALAWGTPHGVQAPGPIEIVLDTADYPGLTRGYALEATEAAASEWMSAPCGGLEIGVVVDADRARAEAGDGVNSILFGSEGGTDGTSAGAAYTGELVVRDGGEVPVLLDYDSVISLDAPWVSDADISAWDCKGGLSLQGWLTHEIGHLLGLTHSCEEGEECADQSAREATMYWAMAECDLEFSFTNADDEAAIGWLYGSPDSCGEATTGGSDTGPPPEVTPGPTEGDSSSGCGSAAVLLFVPLAWRRRRDQACPWMSPRT